MARMFRGGRNFSIGIGVAMSVAWAAAAAEPSINVIGGETGSSYAAGLEAATRSILSRSASTDLSGNGPAIYFDLSGPLDQVPGIDQLSSSDRALTRAALQTYALYRAFGGAAVDRHGVIQRQDGRVYIGLDGQGGRWVASAEMALVALVQDLDRFSFRFRDVGSSGQPCPFDFRCLLLATYTGIPKTIAVAARGTTVTLELNGTGFDDANGPPFLFVSDGFKVEDVEFHGAERIVSRLSIDADAELGDHVIRVFNAHRALRDVVAYGIRVVATVEDLLALIEPADGSEPESDAPKPLAAEKPGDEDGYDHPSDRADAVRLDDFVAARIDFSSDIDVFKVDVPRASELTVASAGATDLSAVLERSDGTEISRNDDGGAWYNFALRQSLAPGTYYLVVRHCCGGTGRYSLTSTLVPE